MQKQMVIFDGMKRRTWANINLDNIEYNFHQIKNSIKAKLCCVVKANAYGHGAVELSSMYEKMGADFLAVSNIEEALQLRNNKIAMPILILGYTPPECAGELSKYNLSQTVYSLEYAESLIKYATYRGCQLRIHIKMDTGMGRIGFAVDRGSLDNIVSICRSEALVSEGIFTHFSTADEGDNGREYTKWQQKRFIEANEYLKKQGINFKIVHSSNSAAICDYPECNFDMVRAGIILYGLYPSDKVVHNMNLKKAMELVSVISHIKHIAPGDSISYGRTFIASRDMKIATVPIGYADGLWRNNGNMKYSLKVNGQYAPIVGRICMDQLMIDVTNIQCAIGDEVLVFGDDERCSADALAKVNNTINYEIVCAVGERVPRLFLRSGKVVGYSDSLL